MTVAIFDLDFTIIEGDSEWLWGEFITEKGFVDSSFMRGLAEYFQLYEAGALDIRDYERYFLQPLSRMDAKMIKALQIEFSDLVRKHYRPAMVERINWHREKGHTTLLISATNQLLVEPISLRLNFPHTLCTQIEMRQTQPTGEIIGIPAYREGKVKKLAAWLKKQDISMDGSWAYSDSLNDIPLLETAENPVAVTPDPALRKHARLKGWRIMDL